MSNEYDEVYYFEILTIILINQKLIVIEENPNHKFCVSSI